MIQIYTGVPGSGKSYKMVHDLNVFLQKDPDITLISNIRNLKLAHVDFDELLDDLFPGQKRSQKIESFFKFEHQQALGKQYGGPIMYVLDECQLYFPRRTGLPQTEEYFQRHRHLGHYIYLATQSARLINANLIPLIEIEYHAARRTISFFGEIHYKEKTPQSPQVIRKITLRPKQEIFDLYQSFETAEIKRPRPMLFKFFIIPLLFLPAFYWFYDKYLRVPDKEEKRQEQQQPQPVNAPSAGYQQVVQERDQLVMTVANLQSSNESLKQQLNDKERVFLTVVKAGPKRLTIDPDTQAVVDLKLIRHKISCLNDGLTCYYDRPVNSGVKVADTSGRVGSFGVLGVTADSLPSGAGMANATLRVANPNAGISSKPSTGGHGSFVEPSMVPPPDHVRLKVYNGLED